MVLKSLKKFNRVQVKMISNRFFCVAILGWNIMQNVSHINITRIIVVLR